MLNHIRKLSTRVPLIKFRQGKSPNGHDSGVHMSQSGQSISQGKSNRVSSGQVIEDWQLPRRYRRRPISEEECMAINMGGAI